MVGNVWCQPITSTEIFKLQNGKTGEIVSRPILHHVEIFRASVFTKFSPIDQYT